MMNLKLIYEQMKSKEFDKEDGEVTGWGPTRYCSTCGESHKHTPQCKYSKALKEVEKEMQK